MKTPIEFDYDLWTTEEGKCMVRIKCTGEVCEVDRETMRFLRSEEMKIKRSKTGVPVVGCKDRNETKAILSLDFVSVQDAEEMSPAWLEDTYDFTDDVLVKITEKEFYSQLTNREKAVYSYCIKNGYSQKDYAAISGLSISRVCKIMTAIRKKAKKLI